ncbi:hypothetical protein [Usitatibacter palustris]|uniref:DUF4398 domain-containing protein n=1 Tax=Usitatibacter palustris TaxID=2732487 RepID=A0A6M4H3I1_9PROT|nr:hypothetical protein [Usitatibacter palustris]QJR13905.1 hypothetical protein DSM104440_00695 [Usitatibacter palustris]
MRAYRLIFATLLVACLSGPTAAWAQSSSQRVDAAIMAVDEARRELQSAQNNPGPDDWVIVGGGRRVPSPAYQAKLEALEAKVKRAEAALEEAKRAAL